MHDQVIPGDVLVNYRGGVFWTDDPQREQIRLDAGEVFLTGPIFGAKIFAPKSDAAELENEVLRTAGLSKDSFKPFVRLAGGTRRSILARPGGLSFFVDKDTVELTFFLSPGTYATVMLRELVDDLYQ